MWPRNATAKGVASLRLSWGLITACSLMCSAKRHRSSWEWSAALEDWVAPGLCRGSTVPDLAYGAHSVTHQIIAWLPVLEGKSQRLVPPRPMGRGSSTNVQSHSRWHEATPVFSWISIDQPMSNSIVHPPQESANCMQRCCNRISWDQNGAQTNTALERTFT